MRNLNQEAILIAHILRQLTKKNKKDDMDCFRDGVEHYVLPSSNLHVYANIQDRIVISSKELSLEECSCRFLGNPIESITTSTPVNLVCRYSVPEYAMDVYDEKQARAFNLLYTNDHISLSEKTRKMICSQTRVLNQSLFRLFRTRILVR